MSEDEIESAMDRVMGEVDGRLFTSEGDLYRFLMGLFMQRLARRVDGAQILARIKAELDAAPRKAKITAVQA